MHTKDLARECETLSLTLCNVHMLSILHLDLNGYIECSLTPHEALNVQMVERNGYVVAWHVRVMG